VIDLNDIRGIIEKAEKENNAKILKAKKMSLEQGKAEERFRRRF